ncbi:MAG: type IV pilus modification protein PilV [Neisseriaceae bacterium]|nr:type IV pilus modification protein PilV [Neisseriaceae bacterium]
MKTLNKRYIQGATLVEVMVSVFVLTFGILALMLTQIRSVASIAQAENQTLIAQAAEALAEGMQVNPKLEFTGGVGSKSVLTVKYTNYDKGKVEIKGGAKFKKLSDLKGNGKEDLAKLQLGNFEAALQQLPDIEQIHYRICQDKETPDEPEMTAAGFKDNCAAGGFVNGAVIKVGWVMANASKQGEKTTFTYMLKVKG